MKYSQNLLIEINFNPRKINDHNKDSIHKFYCHCWLWNFAPNINLRMKTILALHFWLSPFAFLKILYLPWPWLPLEINSKVRTENYLCIY